MKKIVVTGAGGALGGRCREALSKLADELVSTDLIEALPDLFENETYVSADLGDFAAVNALMKGADMVVHFGAIADEAPFQAIMHSNIMGAYNVWEAAYQNDVKRVIYASSIHAVGMYPKSDVIGTDVPHRPDTFYGLAKCFGEDLGRLYWEKRGIESICMRISSCIEPVANPRMLSSWLSYADMVQLVEKSVTVPTCGFSIIYGISNNDRATFDNTKANHIGFRPNDNAEDFAKEILINADPADPSDPSQMRLGGPFAIVELGESGVSLIKKTNMK